MQSIVDFIYESGILSKTPRSGLWFLGTGSQSVAEHLFRTALIGYMLSHLVKRADKNRVIFLCLFHDVGEGRTSDLNYVHQRYGRLAEPQAIEDIARSLPFGKEIKEAFFEEQGGKTLEAKLAKDADKLEWLATMREEFVKGNTKAKSWAQGAFKHLKTPIAKKIGKMMMATHPDRWWFDEKDKWFETRDPKFRSWKRK